MSAWEARKFTKMRLPDSSQMLFRHFKIERKISETCSFLGTIRHPYFSKLGGAGLTSDLKWGD